MPHEKEIYPAILVLQDSRILLFRLEAKKDISFSVAELPLRLSPRQRNLPYPLVGSIRSFLDCCNR